MIWKNRFFFFYFVQWQQPLAWLSFPLCYVSTYLRQDYLDFVCLAMIATIFFYVRVSICVGLRVKYWSATDRLRYRNLNFAFSMSSLIPTDLSFQRLNSESRSCYALDASVLVLFWSDWFVLCYRFAKFLKILSIFWVFGFSLAQSSVKKKTIWCLR